MKHLLSICIILWGFSFNGFAKPLTWKNHIKNSQVMVSNGQIKKAIDYLEAQTKDKNLSEISRIMIAREAMRLIKEAGEKYRLVPIIKPIYEEGLSAHGPRHEITCWENRLLIQAYIAAGEYNQAFKQSELLVKSAPTTSTKALAYAELANLYRAKKQPLKAQKYYQFALKLLKKINQEGHYSPQISAIYNNLALTYGEQEDYKKELDLYFDSLRFKDQDSKGYYTTLFNIASTYQSHGKLQEAKKYLEQVVGFYSQSDKENDLPHLHAVNLLGIVEGELEHYSAALKLYQKLFDISKSINHEIYQAKALNNIASIYRKQGHLSLAENYYQKALARRQKFPSKRELVSSFENLALLASAKKDYYLEQNYYQKALGILENLHEEEHPDYANILANMAMGLQNLKQFNKAEHCYKKALGILEKYPSKRYRKAFVMTNLATMYVEYHDYKQAEPLFLQAIEIQQQTIGEKHPDIAYTYNNTGRLYSLLNQSRKAASYYKKAVSIAAATAGPNHPSTQQYRRNLLKAKINSLVSIR